VYVYLTPSETVHKTGQDTGQVAASKTVQDAYVRSLEDQISFLRRELERKDAILLNLSEQIPQLEAPEGSEPRSATGGSQEAAQGPQPRPWWRRMFGG